MAKTNGLAKVRMFAWIGVAVAALAGGALLLGELQKASQQGASLPGAVRIGGDFELTAHTGKPFTSEHLKGKPYMVFFGFTHCPDICPTTLMDITKHLDALGEKGKELEALFITVDPERDTPEHLASYLSSFGDRVTGLTGSPEDIAKVAKSYRAIYEKVPTADGEDYTMNHTATVYLFDRTGRLTSTLSLEEKEDVQRKKLAKLLNG